MKDCTNRVLDITQSGFPLVEDPYAQLAGQLGVSRAEIADALRDLREQGAVRRIGASFSSAKLGYFSTLCALAVPEGREEEVARIVNAYPGVTHNYRRENRYNMWFTLIARNAGEAERIVGEISQRTGCDDALNLPASKLFKIRVDFGGIGNAGSRGAAGDSQLPAAVQARLELPNSALPATCPFDPRDPRDIALVRWAQGDVVFNTAGEPIERPFAALEEAGIPQDTAITRLRELLADGTIRRFGAIVRHQNLGYACNGMTVWDVAAEHVDACGSAFANMPYVSHCYERPRAASWPHNLYAMVHARTQEELDAHVAELQVACPQAGEPLVLVSTREYKKASMRYFEEG